MPAYHKKYTTLVIPIHHNKYTTTLVVGSYYHPYYVMVPTPTILLQAFFSMVTTPTMLW